MEYEITVKTADKRNAGTGIFTIFFAFELHRSFIEHFFIDANVHLSIFGDKNQIERSELKQSVDKSRNLFEAGATNRFQVHGPDVGKVKQNLTDVPCFY